MYTLNIKIANMIYSYFNLPDFNLLKGSYLIDFDSLNTTIMLLDDYNTKIILMTNVPKQYLPDKWRRTDTSDINNLCKFTRRSCITLLKYVLSKQKINYTLESSKDGYILTINSHNI